MRSKQLFGLCTHFCEMRYAFPPKICAFCKHGLSLVRQIVNFCRSGVVGFVVAADGRWGKWAWGRRGNGRRRAGGAAGAWKCRPRPARADAFQKRGCLSGKIVVQ